VDKLLANQSKRQLLEIFASLRVGALNEAAKLLG
jgi:hypothetical protein